ncbi:hypothetical protein [Vagococcus xieshaowenii]|uniref:Uncharacterized protein n=1 Tax=Vagococcus xieshaowenii TaxID=2562451 RepID=A0AAJ5EFL0_9ENTE|nr:hypothetical protein [Vagococcus xieshaowenii]QCA28459.1 hypothetical protein E4Z98_03700 [Vagococcus xieshaowenii]TFZ42786.1 hypothetical protein E4031_02040 [Vagococcus xieshaowenii]
MKKIMWLLLALLILAGGFIMTRKAADKEVVLKENQALVEVISVGDSRFTGKIIEGGDEIAYKDEIVFTFDSNDKVSQLKEDEQVVLELPELPIMTNSLPPQMPRTTIINN